ncbi:unnamed protein product, partial [Rotaria sordida]
KIELQSLNEKLNHLAEYDRNLKFELTLYRGVLEGEYRRKQQQLMNNQHPSRPTTLRTTTIRNHKNSPILTNRNEPEAIVEKSNVHVDETQSPIKNLDDENNIQLDHQESNKSFNQNQEEIIESTGNISQEIHQTSSEISKSSIPIDQSLPSDEQLSPTDDEVSSEIPKFPHLFTLSEGQPISIDFGQSPTTSEGVQIYLITASADETTPISNSVPVLTQMYRPFSADTEDGQKPSNILESSSSIPISTDIEVSPEVEKSSIASTISDDQQDSSEIHPSSSIQLEDKE